MRIAYKVWVIIHIQMIPKSFHKKMSSKILVD